MTRLLLTFHDAEGPRHAPATIERLIIAGWTGRDRAAVQAHIDELALLGVRPPASVPVFYRVAAARLTTAPLIEVTGPRSSGEAECVVLHHAERLWVGLGSDHTDRAAEAYDISASKQMCDKPIAAGFWPLTDIASHWDRLVLRSWADDTLYQSGTVAELLDVRALMDAAGGLRAGDCMFCGTLPVQGGVRPSATFRATLTDPLLDRTLSIEYNINVL